MPFFLFVPLGGGLLLPLAKKKVFGRILIFPVSSIYEKKFSPAQSPFIQNVARPSLLSPSLSTPLRADR